MDTTTWILLLVLLFLLLRKKATAATNTATRPGLLPSGAAKPSPSILQQFFGVKAPDTTAPSKPSSGVSVGGGGGGAGTPPSATKPPATSVLPWRPTRKPVNLQPSAPLSSLVPSVPPPVYDIPERNYPGLLDTIPSDTSGIFVMPEEPPTYEQTSAAVVDWGAITPSEQILAGIIDQTPFGYQPGDPTYFNPVDLQTIDTSDLGGLSYMSNPDDGSNFFAAAGGYGGASGSTSDVYSSEEPAWDEYSDYPE